MRTLAVIPAHDEEATVGRVVEAVRAQGLDALVVDDGSVDGTADAARAAGARVVRLPVNVGVGGALRCGFMYAVRHGYRRVVQVDADLQHDPVHVPELLEAARASGAQLLVGSRFGAGAYPVGWPRRQVMRILASLVSRRVGVRLDDVTSGFRVVSEPLLSRFAAAYPGDYLGDTVEAILIAHQLGAPVAQHPVPMSTRQGGRATSGLRAGAHLLGILLALMLGSWRARMEAP